MIEGGELLDTEVGDGGVQLQAGGGGDRPQGIVGHDLCVVGLRHCGHLFAGGQAAEGADVGAEVFGGPLLENGLEFLNIDEALARGHRNVGAARNVRHGLGAIRRDGVFQEQGAVFLNAFRKGDSFAGIHAAVAFQDQVEAVSHGLTAGFHLSGVGFHLVVVDAAGAVRRGFGNVPGDHEAGRVVALFLEGDAEIGHFLSCVAEHRFITSHFVPAFSAEKLVDRHAQGLALDVPKGDIDGGECAHDHGTPEIHAAVQIIPVMFDAKGVLADEIVREAPENALHAVKEAPGPGLADAVNALVGGDFDEQVFTCGDDF